MKRFARYALSILIPLIQAAPAGAEWLWYYQQIPYVTTPGFWFYQYLPQGPAAVQPHPGLWYYQSVPPAPGIDFHGFGGGVNSVFVEQRQYPAGYSIRVHIGPPGTQQIDVGVRAGALVIRTLSTGATAPWVQRSDWMTQWVSLPVDANMGAMRIARTQGLIEIFVPRR